MVYNLKAFAQLSIEIDTDVCSIVVLNSVWFNGSQQKLY